MGDVQSIMHLEQPSGTLLDSFFSLASKPYIGGLRRTLSELQKVITADENQINQLKGDGQVFAEAYVVNEIYRSSHICSSCWLDISLKTLRDPIHDLHRELFPSQSTDTIVDPTVRVNHSDSHRDILLISCTRSI